jgi:hypothetical protein
MIRRLVLTFLAVIVALGLGRSVIADAARGDEESISKVTGSIHIAAGDRVGDLSTVNGSIHIGTHATAGRAKTVNGSIHVEPQASVAELETTNGSIHVQGAQVTGNLHTLNGGLHIEDGSEIGGNVANLNGGVHIGAVHIHGSIHTANGAIDLGPNAHVDGDVTMEPDHSSHFGNDCPTRVVIEPGTVVKGKLHFERRVRLYVSDRATIGLVEGAQVVKFSGDHPPEDCSY